MGVRDSFWGLEEVSGYVGEAHMAMSYRQLLGTIGIV